MSMYEVRLVEASGELVPQSEFCTKAMPFESAVAYVRGYASRMKHSDFETGRMPVPMLVEPRMMKNPAYIHTSIHEQYRVDRDQLNAELRSENNG